MPKGEHLKGKGGPKKFGKDVPNNLGGRKPKPKFVDLLEEISENDGKLVFDKFEIIEQDEKEKVVVRLPNDMALAIKLLTMANKDVRWFSELAKVRSLYAPTKNKNEHKFTGVEIDFDEPEIKKK